MNKHHSQGISSVELIIGLLMFVLCAAALLVVLKEVDRGRLINSSRTKAEKLSAALLQEIREKAWDEGAVAGSPSTMGKGFRIVNLVANASQIGPEGGDRDDVDDYNGHVATSGRYTVTIGVTYVNVPIDGTAMTITGDGSNTADRTNFKLVTATTDMDDERTVVLQTIVANGR